MTTDDNIIRIDLRRAIRFAHRFICTGCSMDVYAAVHYGRADMCLTCQEVGPEMSRWLNERFGQAPASKAIEGPQ